MTLIDLGPPAAEPVTLADVKSWCRIDRDDEDALISGLVRAARLQIESETGLVLARRAFRLCVDAVPEDGWLEIPRRPLKAVTGVVAYDGTGTPAEYGPEEAVIERALGIEAIRLSPAVRSMAVNGAEVEFEVGCDAGEAPEPLLVALRRIVATAYEVRGAVSSDQQPAVIPPLAAALISPYRRMRL